MSNWVNIDTIYMSYLYSTTPYFLVFVDAPNILQPADLVGFNLESLGAGEASAENSEPDPSTIPRGWWRHNPEKNTYIGVLDSLILLRDILAKDKYEVMFYLSPDFSTVV